MRQNKTFIEISNQDIFDKLCTMEQKVDEICSKYSTTRWIASTALTLSIGVIFFLLGIKLVGIF